MFTIYCKPLSKKPQGVLLDSLGLGANVCLKSKHSNFVWPNRQRRPKNDAYG